ncbi:MAG: 1-deoxy-D-xylulose-5-phosphate reductoisomerase [Nitrospirae bacterium YQR-1]
MDSGQKKISVLGSTGSIGRSTLEVIAGNPDKFKVCALSANNNTEVLKEQIRLFKPDVAALSDVAAAGELYKWAQGNGHKNCRILSGGQGVCDVAAYVEADFVVSAIVGAAGLKPTLSAIRAKKHIGLANKETLVMAGAAVMAEAQKYGVKILPIDSEHSAIFQCLEGHDSRCVKRLILTASGGPFFGKTRQELQFVTRADALKHPNWEMGAKITVDSATLMNKGLEVIEAHHLFGFSHEEISVVVHPQSIIHSMVEFTDGSVLAELSVPDMKGPIAYALSYPERITGVLKSVNLEELCTLSFHKPDTEAFICLRLAYEALREGGTMPAVLNGANEAAVGLFISDVINFNMIPDIIKEVMDAHDNKGADNLESVFEADRWARAMVAKKFWEVRE